MKRKRANEPSSTSKRLKASDAIVKGSNVGPFSHTVLSFCYQEVCSLRHYLVNSLPTVSRIRRRKITTYKLENGSDFLDTTLVGIPATAHHAQEEERHRDFIAFTQSQQKSTDSSNGTAQECHLAEVRFNCLLPWCMLLLPKACSTCDVSANAHADSRLRHMVIIPAKWWHLTQAESCTLSWIPKSTAASILS
jgi:hypothetical protein